MDYIRFDLACRRTKTLDNVFLLNCRYTDILSDEKIHNTQLPSRLINIYWKLLFIQQISYKFPRESIPNLFFSEIQHVKM